MRRHFQCRSRNLPSPQKRGARTFPRGVLGLSLGPLNEGAAFSSAKAPSTFTLVRGMGGGGMGGGMGHGGGFGGGMGGGHMGGMGMGGRQSWRPGINWAFTAGAQPSIARHIAGEASMPDVASLAGARPSITVTVIFVTVASSRSLVLGWACGAGMMAMTAEAVTRTASQRAMGQATAARTHTISATETFPGTFWAASAALFCGLRLCSCAVKENFRKVRLNGPSSSRRRFQKR